MKDLYKVMSAESEVLNDVVVSLNSYIERYKSWEKDFKISVNEVTGSYYLIFKIYN